MSTTVNKNVIQVPTSVLKGVTVAVQRECRRQFKGFVDKIKSDLASDGPDGLTEEQIEKKANEIVDELCNQLLVVEPSKVSKKKVKIELNSPEDAKEKSQLNNMKVSQLTSYLKGCKLNHKGKKALLVERVWKNIDSPDTLTEEDKKVSTSSRGRPSNKKKKAEVVEVGEELQSEDVDDDDFKNVMVKTDDDKGQKLVVDKMGDGVKKYFYQKNGDEVFEKVTENGQEEYWLVGMFIEKDGKQHVDFEADMDDDDVEEE
jgi:hypothetical protein